MRLTAHAQLHPPSSPPASATSCSFFPCMQPDPPWPCSLTSSRITHKRPAPYPLPRYKHAQPVPSNKQPAVVVISHHALGPTLIHRSMCSSLNLHTARVLPTPKPSDWQDTWRTGLAAAYCGLFAQISLIASDALSKSITLS
jgi:hypothetical protein